jgi:hypothetical protein
MRLPTTTFSPAPDRTVLQRRDLRQVEGAAPAEAVVAVARGAPTALVVTLPRLHPTPLAATGPATLQMDALF